MAMPLPKPVEPSFPGPPGFEDGLGVELRQLPGYQVGDLFEYAFLAAARHVHEERPGVRMLKSDHRGGRSAGAYALLPFEILLFVFDQLTVEFVDQ